MLGFIKSLQTVPGHYCRQDSKRQYLEMRFQWQYQLYAEYVRQSESDMVPLVSEDKFEKLFKSTNIRLVFCLIN